MERQYTISEILDLIESNGGKLSKQGLHNILDKEYEEGKDYMKYSKQIMLSRSTSASIVQRQGLDPDLINKIHPELSSVGVIVGRFQVDDLHDGHISLIDNVKQKHRKVVIFLGVTPVLSSKRNPLDFESRKNMIEGKFDDVTVVPLPDMSSNELWSKTLDNRIAEIYPNSLVLLYGSRDSFIQHYTGKHSTYALQSIVTIAGSQIRENIHNNKYTSKDFRAGNIFSTFNQYPRVHTTVDIAIIRENEVLLGKKADESKYRFIGGFADPKDDDFENTARREVIEETGLEVNDFQYISSHKIDDWRYRNEIDKIITIFYKASYTYGKAQPADDIAFLKWFKISDITEADVMPEHHILLESLIKSVR